MDNIYNGEKYDAAHAPNVQRPSVAPLADPSGALKGINAIANNIGVFGEVIQKRYKDKRDNENQLVLQQKDAEFKAEFKRRMDLPNGADGGFYDKNGQPNIKAMQTFVDEHIREALKTNSGYATPFDKEQRDEYLTNYAAKTRQDAEASLIGSVKQRGLKAFNDAYKLYLASDDYGSAAMAAKQAYKNNLISEDEMKLYCLRSLKGNSRKTAAGGGDMSGVEVDAVWSTYKEPEDEAREVEKEQVDDQGDDISIKTDARLHVLPEDESGVKTRVAQPVGEEWELYSDSLIYEGLSTPNVYYYGLKGYNVDEYARQQIENANFSSRLSVSAGADGALAIPENEAAPTPYKNLAAKANATGGISIDEHRRCTYAIVNDILESGEYDSASVKDLKDYLVGAASIDGAGAVLFPDADNPDLAYNSFINNCIESVQEARKAGIEGKLTDIENSREGRRGVAEILKSLDAQIAASFSNKELASLARANENTFSLSRWWNGDVPREEFVGIITMFKDRFVAETGKGFENINDFRDWVFAKNGPADELKKAYVAETKSYLRARAIDAVVDYRRGGGNSWAEEQLVIENAISDGMKNLKGGGEWARYEVERQHAKARRAEKYRLEADEARKKLSPLQEAAAKEKLKNQEVAERQKWQESQEKTRLHAQWKAEEEAREKASSPYKYPVQKRIQVRNAPDNEQVITVPRSEYEKICAQTGARAGVVCTYGSGKKEYVVRAGDVKEITMSTSIYNEVFKNKKLTREQRRQIILGHEGTLKFKPIY